MAAWVKEYSQLFGWGNMLRSAEMEYMTLHMRESVALSVVERLGHLGVVQFTDLNGDLTTFKRFYTPQIRRCDELEKKLLFFVEEMKRTNTPAPEPRTQEAFLLWRGEQARMAEHYGCPSLLDYWESIISERHRDYLSLKAEREKNAAVLTSAGARRHVIEAAVKWFDVDIGEGGEAAGGSSGSGSGSGSGGEPFRGAGLRAAGSSAAALESGKAAAAAAAAPKEGGGGEGEDVAFRHIAGILRHEDQARFARIVFRASVGHAAVRFSPIPASLMDERGESGRKAVFAVLYRGKALAPKLERICAAFGAQTHALPNFSNPTEVAQALSDTKALISTTIAWMKGSAAMAAHTLGHLRLAATQWRMGVAREKAALVALNGFTRNPEAGTMSAAGWVLKSDSGAVKEAIAASHSEAAGGGRALPYRVDIFAVIPTPQALQRFQWTPASLKALRVSGSGDYIGLPTAKHLQHHSQHHHHHHHHHPGVGEGPIPMEGYIGVADAKEGGGGREGEGRVLVLPACPPTFFPVNKVTAVFQGIVNTYGMPRYQEANPALFTIVTFPFLFGVMFGDLGHATFLTVFSAWMVWKEDSLASVDNEIFGMAFGGRYMLLMMGFFSIYCGLIYNDFFSLGMTVMGQSRWTFPVVEGAPSRFAVTSGAASDVYQFGIDPAWHLSENSLLFFNSLKMKMSVVLGITQMTFGLLLRCSNALYFRSRTDFWFEAVPQVIFMVSLFGYMVFLIIAKWCINWFGGPSESPGSPPSLIDTLINIALKPSSIDPPDKMFVGQGSFQQLVLAVAFLTVPVMLFAKPYLLSRPPPGGGDGEAKKDEEGHGHGGGEEGGDHGHHSFGELFIHQAIETIEFVLGSVSNTASYLRLWALSLAHSQLATVFWERALVASVQMESFLYIFIGYAVFAGITTGVLLIMDVLECFLHALRLHWVEFQNKFYKADGRKFVAFSFAAIKVGGGGKDE